MAFIEDAFDPIMNFVRQAFLAWLFVIGAERYAAKLLQPVSSFVEAFSSERHDLTILVDFVASLWVCKSGG